MRDLVWIGRFRGYGGFATSTREYFKATRLYLPTVKLASLEVLDAGDPLRKFLVRLPLKGNELKIVNHQPTTDPEAEVYFSVWEYDRIPGVWIDIFNQSKLIMTQSTFCRDIFAGCIDDPEKIKVVPYILPRAYHEPGKILRLFSKEIFVFGSVFEWVPRKVPELLIKAFSNEFSKDDRVRLVLKTHHPNGKNIEELVHKITGDSRIIILDRVIEDLSAFYRGLNAYISPTAGEGWGQTLTEAMACGIPTIASRHGGNLDFMNDDNSYLVDVGDWSNVVDKNGRRLPYKWRLPRLESIQEEMRRVYVGWRLGKKLKTVRDVKAFCMQFDHVRVGKMIYNNLKPLV
ncbi:MAG: glycosyltransferase [Promethearchaeota archaeon]